MGRIGGGGILKAHGLKKVLAKNKSQKIS